jgi:hypothetical protein
MGKEGHRDHFKTAWTRQPPITQNIYVHWRDEQIHQAALDVEVCAQELQKVRNRKVTFEPT